MDFLENQLQKSLSILLFVFKVDKSIPFKLSQPEADGFGKSISARIW